jgi:hypothetical protein
LPMYTQSSKRGPWPNPIRCDGGGSAGFSRGCLPPPTFDLKRKPGAGGQPGVASPVRLPDRASAFRSRCQLQSVRGRRGFSSDGLARCQCQAGNMLPGQSSFSLPGSFRARRRGDGSREGGGGRVSQKGVVPGAVVTSPVSPPPRTSSRCRPPTLFLLASALSFHFFLSFLKQKNPSLLA